MKIDHDRAQAIEKDVLESIMNENPEKFKNSLDFIKKMIPKEQFTTYQVELFSLFENPQWPNSTAGHTYFPVEKFYSKDKTKAWFYFYDIDRIPLEFFQGCYWAHCGKQFFKVPRMLFRLKVFYDLFPECDKDQFLFCMFCQSIRAGGFKTFPGAVILMFYFSLLAENSAITVDYHFEDEFLKFNGRALATTIPFNLHKEEEIVGLKQIAHLKIPPMYGVNCQDVFALNAIEKNNGITFNIGKVDIQIPKFRENNFIRWFFLKLRKMLWQYRH